MQREKEKKNARSSTIVDRNVIRDNNSCVSRLVSIAVSSEIASRSICAAKKITVGDCRYRSKFVTEADRRYPSPFPSPRYPRESSVSIIDG